MNYFNTRKEEDVSKINNIFNRVTPFSKHLALLLLIVLPFIGGYIGYTYSPVKIMEVERLVILENKNVLDEVTKIAAEKDVIDTKTINANLSDNQKLDEDMVIKNNNPESFITFEKFIPDDVVGILTHNDDFNVIDTPEQLSTLGLDNISTVVHKEYRAAHNLEMPDFNVGILEFNNVVRDIESILKLFPITEEDERNESIIINSQEVFTYYQKTISNQQQNTPVLYIWKHENFVFTVFAQSSIASHIPLPDPSKSLVENIISKY